MLLKLDQKQNTKYLLFQDYPLNFKLPPIEKPFKKA